MGFGDPVEKGVMGNGAIAYHWESQVEHAYMILEYHRFTGADISAYMPFIEQSLIFFDEHYRKRQKMRDGNELDEKGKLVIFPAHLKHMVFPYNGDDDRIIVSFHAQVLGDLAEPCGGAALHDASAGEVRIIERGLKCLGIIRLAIALSARSLDVETVVRRGSSALGSFRCWRE